MRILFKSKSSYGIMLMCISSVCVCVGQLWWKLSSDGNLLFLLGGFALYGIGAILMLFAYKFGSLSSLQPILSLNYVISICLSVTILQEAITHIQLLGVLLITFGVFLVGGKRE